MKRLALCAGLLLVALPVFAQEPETEAKKLQESRGVTEHGNLLFWGWINFILLAGGLGYLIKKHGGPYFAQRSEQIRKGMVDAERARAEADAKVAEVDRRLANLAAEIESLRREAHEEGRAAAHRIRLEAAAEMAKIQTRTVEEIVAAGKAARLDLRRYSAGLALSLAQTKIAARLSPQVQDSLVNGFVAHLAHLPLHVESN
jgi:F-type H+-transporting ATPase subunit b